MSIFDKILAEQKKQTQILSDIRVILSDSNDLEKTTSDGVEAILNVLSPPSLELKLGTPQPQ